jgi:ABC-2 type transport system ATP-binding protein
MNAIEVSKLSKHYGKVRAIDGVSFVVGSGEVIALLGPNGAGKTTLMKVLTGYLEPDEGDVAIRGVDVVERPTEAQRHIGYLPESAPLYTEMLVRDYLEMVAGLRGIVAGERMKRIAEAIRATGLEAKVAQPIGTLSKGYRQRVGIAQAMIHEPDVLILDEPTSGLDPSQIVEIRDLIKRLAEKTTVMLSTHILSEVEATLEPDERVLIIKNGRLRADKTLDDLRKQTANAAIVTIAATADGVEDKLAAVGGVTSVSKIDGADDPAWQSWRVVAGDDANELCPQLYDALRRTSWQVAELRPDVRTLERIYREIVETEVVS